MTIYEKLIKEFESAIKSEFGDLADEDYEESGGVDKADILAIAKKVVFYLDL